VRSKSYCIDLKPISWQRAGRNGSRYFDAQARDKLAFGLCLINQHGEEPLFDKAIHLDIAFYMNIPRSKLNNLKSIYHVGPVDLDNLCKFLLDAIKDVLIIDDRIICSMSLKKVYDKHPRTELVITEVE
jgi:Holliday junction resolvase RusA-like endonuclease